MTSATRYEMQILQTDMRMLIAVDDTAIEFISGTAASGDVAGKPYAVLHTDSLATLSGWREVMQAGGRPHRLVNNAYDYRQEVNNPDW
ncbi:hypothetical protein [Paraburkholderia hospita]|uniref:hypothetical protein n=1 Tax=Paraburkholderia hospita TaxID=169430 RepID=UPI000B341A29|nr:hypothetical protein [Paraburkholderia hospita]OUL78585.1 hypothetical protein CA601_36070 [Paraburkholderia hospita]